MSGITIVDVLLVSSLSVFNIWRCSGRRFKKGETVMASILITDTSTGNVRAKRTVLLKRNADKLKLKQAKSKQP